MVDRYDAIIVGGRIAGSAAAAHLARQGERVLVLERATFPAPTLSCPIIHNCSLASLEMIDLLEAVEAIGAPKIRELGQDFGDFSVTASIPAVEGRDYAYSIRRDVLDTALLRRVQAIYPVEVREGFAVTKLIWEDERVVGVRGRPHGGREEEFRADAVIGADGKHSLVAHLTDAPLYDTLPGHACVYYAYYRDFDWDTSARIFRLGDDLASLLFPADDGLTVIAVGAPAPYFHEFQTAPERAFEGGWQSIGDLGARGAKATKATPIRGQGPTQSYRRRPYGPGWALVGDAAYYKDPITGQGIHDGLRAAELLAEAWADVHKGADWESAMARYQQRRDAETAAMYAFTDRLASFEPLTPETEQLFRAIAANPALAAQYVGIYNLVTDPNEFFAQFQQAA
jgi:2-polyprenyl-6-methoxyphenol hydroxylase-like FAD-dependent oxidoreductase